MNAPAIRFYDSNPEPENMFEEVLAGLSQEQKTLSPKYFYDLKGSQLFEDICCQPEYYPTRTEISILAECGTELAEYVGPSPVIIELGSGASRKVRLLLDQLKPRAYIGIDISKDFLLQSTEALAYDYPDVEVHALCADISDSFSINHLPEGKRLAFYPGSSIGNFDPDDAVSFLSDLRVHLGADGGLLIGVDLRKDAEVLHAAYNDQAGVTALFNKNLLTRLCNELGLVVEPDNFQHVAFYNEQMGRVEMHLESKIAQVACLGDRTIAFDSGERIHTESSYKYSIPEFHQLAKRAGYKPQREWIDRDGLFCVYYLSVA